MYFVSGCHPTHVCVCVCTCGITTTTVHTTHIRNFVSLSVMKRAKRAAFISEHTKAFTAAMRDGAISTALDLGLTVVANIGINKCTGSACPTTKPARDALTKLIPDGGNDQHINENTLDNCLCALLCGCVHLLILELILNLQGSPVIIRSPSTLSTMLRGR